MESEKSIPAIVASGISGREDLNCAETMLRAVDLAYDLALPPSALKLAAGFGGGMGVESSCGVITGGIMALSALFVRERAHEGERIKSLSREYIRRFTEKTTSINCSYLKQHRRAPSGDCVPLMYEGACILEDIVQRELALDRSRP
jgi:C_GCAxxG_C_C family probable redox protein